MYGDVLIWSWGPELAVGTHGNILASLLGHGSSGLCTGHWGALPVFCRTFTFLLLKNSVRPITTRNSQDQSYYSSGPAQTFQVILHDEDPYLYMALYILYMLTPFSSPPPHPKSLLPELTVHFQLIPTSSATVEHPQYLCAPMKLDLTRSQLPWRLPKWQLFSLKHLMSCWALLFTADSYMFPDRKHAYSWAHICTCTHTQFENPSFQFIPQANKHLDMITLCQALTWFNLHSAMSYVCFYPQFTDALKLLRC